jgi:hypothetical protein
MSSAILYSLYSILSSAQYALAYRPFVNPLPVWDYWYLLILPLAAAVSVVYKSIKLERMRDVPWQALVIGLWIVFGMLGAAVVLAGVMRIVER